MSPTIEWTDVAIRLAFTVVASALIGINRGEQGRAAGFRTVMLVSLAAAISMLQANLLMNTPGKKSDSFIVLDLMRFPLGILSGMGFIGAGAILRRGKMVLGVTTAATLWFSTVMGLCFGGGQIWLGAAAAALAIMVLWGLKSMDKSLVRDRRAALVVKLAPDGPTDADIRNILRIGPLTIAACSITIVPRSQIRKLQYELDWHAPETATEIPVAIEQIAQRPGVLRLQWKP
ncbi:MAG TPA: MgtC/SapB family protein [Pirellulales bacterium]|jgi:putative Mg2+ transporter-C (MgtC) family protein|nr:MgtC/SapB family protein [Pirellulales bacterium]